MTFEEITVQDMDDYNAGRSVPVANDDPIVILVADEGYDADLDDLAAERECWEIERYGTPEPDEDPMDYEIGLREDAALWAPLD